MMTKDTDTTLPAPLPPLDAVPPPELAQPSEPSRPTEEEIRARAREAEKVMTTALVALKERGKRAAKVVDAAALPAKVIVGAALAVGTGAVLLYVLARAMRRAPRPRARRTIKGEVGRAVARAVAGRVVLGVATTVGAQLAEALIVPMLMARMPVAERPRPARPRRARPTSAVDPVATEARDPRAER